MSAQEPVSVETSVDARLDAIEQSVDTKRLLFFSPLIYLYNPSICRERSERGLCV